MSKGLLGKKVGMTQVFKEDKAIPVTVIEAGPCFVVQLKTVEKDGYEAIQIGFNEQRESLVNLPIKNHFKKAGVSPMKHLVELRLNKGEIENYQLGQAITVEIFSPGEKVDVRGVSKGKGFAGGVKRWGFAGFPASHGSRYHRAPGSVGSSTFPARVIKGKRMPGHMGNCRRTVQNLEIIEVIPGENLLLVKGSVPGANGSVVLIKEAAKLSTRLKKK